MSKVLADPPAQNWQRVSPKLTVVEELSGGIAFLIILLATAVPLVLHAADVWPGYPAWLAWSVPAVVLVIAVISAIMVPFRVRSRRYALRDDDIAVARGVIFHRLEVIPYGRIQYVDVKEGPLLRGFGLCELQVHTASPDAHPEIKGLTARDGAVLREELSRRGEERLAGL